MSEGEGFPPTPEPARRDGVVLAIYTHPDDCEISCGATLAKWAAAGQTVIVAVVTDGEKGSQNPDEDRAALVATRRDETAGRRRPDGRHGRAVPRLRGTASSRTRRRFAPTSSGSSARSGPDLIVCPDPTAWFFGGARTTTTATTG